MARKRTSTGRIMISEAALVSAQSRSRRSAKANKLAVTVYLTECRGVVGARIDHALLAVEGH
jgi:hypothetical protein